MTHVDRNASQHRDAILPEVLVTVDYEGDGLGFVAMEEAVLAPTERLLATSERHGFEVSLFVDVSEFRALASHPQHASNVQAVREQLVSALARGHRAELHLHPQWDQAREIAPNNFALATERWRIANLPPAEIRTQVQEAKAWLEAWLETQVVAFRAGAWGIQPSKAVVEALVSADIRIDSTVAPGTSSRNRLGWYDFRGAPRAAPWWGVRDDVLVPEPEQQLIEVPILAGTTRLRDRLGRALRDRLTGEHKLQASAAPNVSSERSIGSVLRALRHARQARLDPAILDADALVRLAEQWIDARGPGPLVLITHSKSFSDAAERALDGFLAECARRGWRSTTYSQWVAELSR